MTATKPLLAAALIMVGCLAAPAVARESIVGTWADTRAACSGEDDTVIIEPKAIVFDSDSRCEFRSVSRDGDTVRWTDGVCMRGATNTPSDRNVRATASLNAGRLSLRIDAAQQLMNKALVRCPRR
jgi:hypothetical protein